MSLTGAAYIKKNFLIKNDIYFNETPGGHSQDFGFILQCYAFSQSVYIIPKAYVTYRLFSGIHNWKYLNLCMLDECELTLKKLRKKKLNQEIWEIIFLRIAFRLKKCAETASYWQKQRIVREIKRNEKYQNYKYFSLMQKNEIANFIKSYSIKNTVKSWLQNKKTILYKIFRSKENYKFYLFGLPLIKKKNTSDLRYIKILGIPIYYRNQKELFTFYRKMEEMNNNLLMMANSLNQIKTLCYYTPYFAKCVEDLHSKNLLPYKNVYNDKAICICGSGPTLNYYFQLPEVIHIGLNRAFEKKGY